MKLHGIVGGIADGVLGYTEGMQSAS